MTTDTTPKTTADELDRADPNTLADAFQKVKLGTILTPPATVVVKTITLDEVGTVIPLDPPALMVVTCRISDNGDGDAVEGPYVVTDDDTTSPAAAAIDAYVVAESVVAPGVALLAEDGSTLTFAASLLSAVVTYIPRAAEDITDLFETTPAQ